MRSQALAKVVEELEKTLREDYRAEEAAEIVSKLLSAWIKGIQNVSQAESSSSFNLGPEALSELLQSPGLRSLIGLLR